MSAGRRISSFLIRFGALILFCLCCQPIALNGLQNEGFSDTEFQNLSLDLSEAPGFFPSDNLLSNETSYLHVIPALEKFAAPGEAYIGVGPDQNFSYIVHSQPAVAFIMDIRRDNRLQHLFFKVLMSQASNRWEYLSRLFGKPLPPDFDPNRYASAVDLVHFFEQLPSSEVFFEDEFERAWTELQDRFPLLVRSRDRYTLFRIASAFFAEHLNLRYRMPKGRTLRVFPTFRDLIQETDLLGRPGHYLQSEESFQYLRRLQTENRIIPVVGNLAGGKALRSIAQYLRENDYTTSVFYSSNVEFYLARQGLLEEFMKNLKELPVTEKSLLIRSFFNFWYGFGSHPDAIDGYYVSSIAQELPRLVQLHEERPYRDYWDLVTRDYLTNRLELEAQPVP